VTSRSRPATCLGDADEVVTRMPANARRRQRWLLSAVVPVYNEAEGIAEFLRSLAAALREVTAFFEIIVVNDGSRDASAGEVARVASECRTLYLELSRNFGKEAALTAGLEAARGDCVVLIDADGQHPISAIAEMVRLWDSGYDMVYGVRATSESETAPRRFARALFYRLLSRASDVSIPQGAGDFRLLDREVVDALLRLPERNRFMKGLYAWVGYRSIAFTFQTAERASGRSSFKWQSLTELAITGITAFSTLPLRLVSLAGICVSLGSVIFGFFIVLEKLVWGQPIAGFATIAASVFFLSGVQLISLGIIGEYVGRVFVEVKRRPSYLLARTVDSRESEESPLFESRILEEAVKEDDRP
jgi:glycosyltransferase involved in cell wall biosynthesis